MGEQEHVFVAMSGGVDSAVAAVQLLEAGYRVTGIHMRIWHDPAAQPAENTQRRPDVLAKSSAQILGIPFISLDVKDPFYRDVVQPFITQYLSGKTPNPCIFCNPQVKWGILQAYANQHGADCFATGHYARLDRAPAGKVRLLKAVDRTKDQSYVLSMLSQAQLRQTIFPLGEMTKEAVRVKANGLKLPAAHQPDSQDLCFLGKGDYRDFLQRYSPESFQPGEIVDLQGRSLGEHTGLAFYTIGQRKGIRIAAAEPYFVASKDLQKNRLVVGFADQVGKRYLQANRAHWISDNPPEINKSYDVIVRYRADPVPGLLFIATESNFRLEFKKQLRGITPGQAAVLYSGEECLGGGVIQAVD